MDAAPYDAPTYFPASYFYSAASPNPASVPVALLPYNAPTYFAPAYFYGASSSSASPALLPYNAPTYFAPAYFYGASSSASVTPTDPVKPTDPVTPTDPVIPHVPGPDRPPFLALVGLLEATGAFEDVILGSSSRRGLAGAGTYPLAVVTPKGWEESDDVDPTLIVHRTTFAITIVVKEEDGRAGYYRLDCLTTAIKDVVDRSDLGGTCLPALTRIFAGRYEPSGHYPEQSLDLEGEFSTLIDPSAHAPARS